MNDEGNIRQEPKDFSARVELLNSASETVAREMLSEFTVLDLARIKQGYSKLYDSIKDIKCNSGISVEDTLDACTKYVGNLSKNYRFVPVVTKTRDNHSRAIYSHYPEGAEAMDESTDKIRNRSIFNHLLSDIRYVFYMPLCGEKSLKAEESNLAPYIISTGTTKVVQRNKDKDKDKDTILYYHDLDMDKVMADALRNDNSPQTLACQVLMYKLCDKITPKFCETKIDADERIIGLERDPNAKFNKIVAARIQFSRSSRNCGVESRSCDMRLFLRKKDVISEELKEKIDTIKCVVEEYERSEILHTDAKQSDAQENPSTEMKRVERMRAFAIKDDEQMLGISIS